MPLAGIPPTAPRTKHRKKGLKQGHSQQGVWMPFGHPKSHTRIPKSSGEESIRSILRKCLKLIPFNVNVRALFKDTMHFLKM